MVGSQQPDGSDSVGEVHCIAGAASCTGLDWKAGEMQKVARAGVGHYDWKCTAVNASCIEAITCWLVGKMCVIVLQVSRMTTNILLRIAWRPAVTSRTEKCSSI